MAGEQVKVLVDIAVKGREQLKGAAADFNALDRETAKTAGGFGAMASKLALATGVIAGAAIAGKKLYDTLRAGAQLQTTTERFDKLSASIGTTADTMLGKLRTATQGMIADAQLMASASQIMSLKLADNEAQVIRLATVAGTLNWDMQQVILTFANMSTMRLDALGLSVEEVTAKAKELEAAGMTAQQAFKEAVILAGEARLDVGGVSENEQAFKQLEAAIANTKDEFSIFLIQLADSIGLIDAMSNAAAGMNLRRVLSDMREEGKLTAEEFNKLWAILRYQGPEAAQAALEATGKLKVGLEFVDNALLSNQNAWAAWANGVAVQSSEAARVVAANMNAAFLAITGLDQGLMGLDWAGGVAPPKPSDMRGQEHLARQRARVAGVTEMYREQDLARAREVGSLQQATAAWGGYGSAISQADLEAQALLETHARMVSAFQQEAGMDLAEGLINAEGLVNIENANKALYEQAQAAGVSASGLALLGVATGQLTDEQAQAALKAAVLMERIKQLAAGVASGDLSIDDALGGLGDFRAQLDSGAFAGAAGGIEGLATAAEEFANGSYQATLDVENAQANAMINDTAALISGVEGTHYINLVTTSNTPTAGPGTGTGRAGAPISVNQPAAVSSETTSGRSGGAVYNVSVTNYVDGKQAAKGSLDDITADKMAAALRGLGLGGR